MEFVKRIAEQKRVTPAQIALAWLESQALDSSDPGTTKLHRLEENLGAVEVELTADDLIVINQALKGSASRGSVTPKVPNE